MDRTLAAERNQHVFEVFATDIHHISRHAIAGKKRREWKEKKKQKILVDLLDDNILRGISGQRTLHLASLCQGLCPVRPSDLLRFDQVSLSPGWTTRQQQKGTNLSIGGLCRFHQLFYCRPFRSS
ncbi:hypothetical protein CDAR_381831 [Caerostris darwini]|uniref:Uncharacterized protein n=1 Tax=Caerostris darwini TaxID=1538125 RepID=A0AAV4V5P5_9ARAC|nr:hypothetical protein CDAR_381831 [Caerostris darwini]